MMFTMIDLKYLIPLTTSVILVGCSGSSTEATTEVAKADKVPDITTTGDKVDPVKGIPVDPVKVIPVLTLSFTPTKAFHFTWPEVPDATSYKIQEDINSGGDYQDITTTTATSFDHIVPLYGRVNARYVLQSCIADKCTPSAEVFTSTRLTDMASSIGYFKASNTDAGDRFGYSVSVSEDGNTLAVGAPHENSVSKIINGDQGNDSATGLGGVGAVYVFTRSGAVWGQEAYLKAGNAGASDQFGISISLSANGNTLVVGAPYEDGSATDDGVGEDDAEVSNTGAAYVFTRSEITWTQEKYLKASNAGSEDYFGFSVSLSADGHTLAVGAPYEDGSAADGGVGEDDADVSNAGAVYVFARSGTMWTQPKYLKAKNAGSEDYFGYNVSLNADGNTLAVGAYGEAEDAGAVYVFARTVSSEDVVTWSEPVYLKASNTDADDQFGRSVSISADGNTLAVAAPEEDSMATGVHNNALQSDGGAPESGAVYVFTRDSATTPPWSQQAYLKANNTGADDLFGHSVSISADGNILVVGAKDEGSDAVGIYNEGQASDGVSHSGAVYTFTRADEIWSAQAYLKARITGSFDRFGYSLALSGDGGTLAVGAYPEDSNAKGVNADQGNDDAIDSGAVYVY